MFRYSLEAPREALLMSTDNLCSCEHGEEISKKMPSYLEFYSIYPEYWDTLTPYLVLKFQKVNFTTC